MVPREVNSLFRARDRLGAPPVDGISTAGLGLR